MLAPLLVTLALATPPADLTTLFASDLPQVKEKTELAILLPDKMPTESEKLFPSSYGSCRSRSPRFGWGPTSESKSCRFQCRISALSGRSMQIFRRSMMGRSWKRSCLIDVCVRPPSPSQSQLQFLPRPQRPEAMANCTGSSFPSIG